MHGPIACVCASHTASTRSDSESVTVCNCSYDTQLGSLLPCFFYCRLSLFWELSTVLHPLLRYRKELQVNAERWALTSWLPVTLLRTKRCSKTVRYAMLKLIEWVRFELHNKHQMELKLIRKLEVCIGPIGESNLGQQMAKVTTKYIASTVVCNKLLPFFFVCRANVKIRYGFVPSRSEYSNLPRNSTPKVCPTEWTHCLHVLLSQVIQELVSLSFHGALQLIL